MAIGVQLERDQLNNWTINGPGRLANSISASILISFVLFVSFAAILQPFIGGLSPFPCYFFFFDAPPFYRHSLQLIRHSSQLSRAILFASVLGFLAILSAFLTDSHNLQPSSRVFHAFRLIICGHFAAILRPFCGDFEKPRPSKRKFVIENRPDWIENLMIFFFFLLLRCSAALVKDQFR